jgi:hypothetical protein
MIDHNRGLDIKEKYIYEDDEGNKTYDFCESCNRPVEQEDLGDGIFGCEFCKSANQISINQINQTPTDDYNNRKDKCIYCEDNKKATHFICVDCGCGMCDDCYDNDTEHHEHCFDFSESIEDEKLYKYIVKKVCVNDGYLCYRCMAEHEIRMNEEQKNGNN